MPPEELVIPANAWGSTLSRSGSAKKLWSQCVHHVQISDNDRNFEIRFEIQCIYYNIKTYISVAECCGGPYVKPLNALGSTLTMALSMNRRNWIIVHPSKVPASSEDNALLPWMSSRSSPAQFSLPIIFWHKPFGREVSPFLRKYIWIELVFSAFRPLKTPLGSVVNFFWSSIYLCG